jgi:hypothetical protein
MNLKLLFDKWKVFVSKMNEKGLPIPMVRDPKTGRGDVALTLVVISSIWVQVGLLNKLSNFFGDVDMAQALNWFYACAGLYWARKMSTDGKGKNELGDKLESSTDSK